MKKIKAYLIAATLLCAGSNVKAQTEEFTNGKDYKPYPYMFVSLQGGGQLTFTHYDMTKLATPVGSLSFGGYFTPTVGARLNVFGYQGKGGFKCMDETYNYNFATTSADLMINLTNLFGAPKARCCNVILLGGVGLSYAWDNDEAMSMIAQRPRLGAYTAWEDNLLSHNFRLGMQLDFNLSKRWGAMLEIHANNLSDKFNTKYSNRNDWQAAALVGISYKFGFRKPSIPAPIAIIPQEKPAVVTTTTTTTTTTTPVVVKAEPLKKNIYFDLASSVIRSSEKQKIADIVAWMKKYPNAKVSFTGYADKNTGNKKVNMKYAEERAENVKKAIVAGGVDASRISTSAKGDTVQPYGSKEENRVVICLGEE